MYVWITKEFNGFYPVGVGAVVVARTAKTAAKTLNDELVSRGLKGDVRPEDMTKVDEKKVYIPMLIDGNY